jgi:hypothetical protein
VESWTTSWTVVLGLGYIGQTMSWPELGLLGRDGAMRVMVLATLAAVLGLCVAGYAAAGMAISGWAIGLTLLRRIVTAPE